MRMVLAHSVTKGSRSSIVIPACFINICGPLRRREPTLFMMVRREIAPTGQATGARLGARGKSRVSDRKSSPLASGRKARDCSRGVHE